VVIPLRPITDGAVAATIAQIKTDAPAQIKAVANTADGGTVRVSAETRWRQLEIAGYGGWKRRQGFEAGVEVVKRLGPG